MVKEIGHPHAMIMVAGCPRSGSTILAKILALSHRTAYLEEPLNAQTGIEGTEEMFVYLHDESSLLEKYDKITTDILTGHARYKTSYFKPEHVDIGRQVFYALFINRYNFRYKLGTLNPLATKFISKDPTASFSTEYLHQNFGYTILLTLRHPCAVVASHQQLGWSSPIAHFLNNPELKKQLSPEIQALNVDKLSNVEALAWYWRAVNEVLLQFMQRNTDFKLVEHELFSSQPKEVCRYLFNWLELPFTPFVSNMIDRLTNSTNRTNPRDDRAHTLKRNSKENIDRWKGLLSEADIKKIMKITGDTYQKLQAAPNNIAHDLLSL